MNISSTMSTCQNQQRFSVEVFCNFSKVYVSVAENDCRTGKATFHDRVTYHNIVKK